ncbi:MAG: SusC/RagA family TonB-linked outer membrane protein [Gemmatimonadaceae bacterium]|nr:SusC/RagA family TonB-linked outer membrane protein [Gemmatimonadaceae bacterium]
MRRMSRWSRTLLGALVGVAALAGNASAQAETGTVTGTITDSESRLPMEGARVVVAGTTLETQTNGRGEYRLVGVRPGVVQIGVMRIGYRAGSDTVRVAANGTATLNFSLTRTVTTLQELVVTGTVGNQERRAQPAQVASVSATDIKETAVVNTVNDMLQSRVPGIAVNTASGTAGTNRTIRIRGASSISLSNNPIIFIDGVRFNEGTVNLGLNGQLTDRLNDLNPDDIESVEVVKGPAAATLYGADASAGVIQIITKKGRAGQASFQQTVRAEYGRSDLDWTPPSNFGACTAASVAANSPNPLCRGKTVGLLVSDNPLTREGGIRTGSDQLLGWTGRGGGQNYGYFLSASADRTIGTLPSNDFRRYSWRSNFNWIPNAKVTLEAGVNSIFSKAVLPDNDNNIYGYLGGALLGSPLTRRDDGVASQDGWFGFNRGVAAIAAIQNELDTRRNILNLSATYLPTPWLKSRFTAGGDLLNDEATRFFPKNTATNYSGDLNLGNNTQTRIGIQRYTLDWINDANRSFGSENQLQATLSAGFQAIATRSDNIGAVGQGFVTNAANVITNASTTSSSQSRTDVRQYGWLGQLGLSYRDRIFLQAGGRLDDFSAFGQATEPIFLPKVGLSWVLSEEGWFPQSSLISSFRFRAAYGTTGRAPGAGAALQTLQAAPYANQVGSSITTEAGAVPLNPGNTDLKPERGVEYEVGFDASFLSDRARVELTYFNKTSRDLILQPQLPPSLGFQQNPFKNIGEVLNSGLEVGITAEMLRKRNFQWETRLNFNTLHNELVDLGEVAPFGTLNRFTEGFQLGSFVSKRIKNINTTTKVVTVADTFEVVGNALPTFEAAWSNTFTLFRNLRISTLIDTKQDFYIYNLTNYFRETQLVRSDNRLDPTKLSELERLRRYGNPTPGQPAFVQLNGAGTTVDQARDGFLQPGDFIRFRELGATYSIPTRYMPRVLGTRAASIGLAMQNVALWTDYEGADPELVSSPTEAFGVGRTDFLTLPNPKRVILRFNVSF